MVVADDSGIRLQFSKDLARLWNLFLIQKTKLDMRLPFRPAKIGLHRNGAYHKAQINQQQLLRLNRKKFDIDFNLTETVYVFTSKGFWTCFVNVEDPVLWTIIDDLKLRENFSTHNRPHMTISNSKHLLNG